MKPGFPSLRTRQLWKDRWRAMRDCGVSPVTARDSRTNLRRFREALAAVGRSAAEWPHLNAHIGSSRWSTHIPKTERAEWSAWAYRALKEAGIPARVATLWCRSEVAFHYALHCVSTGRALPLRPSEAKDKHTVVQAMVRTGEQSWAEYRANSKASSQPSK